MTFAKEMQGIPPEKPTAAIANPAAVRGGKASEESPQCVLPVVEERLDVGVRQVITGGVRANVRTETREETVELTSTTETVEVVRVPVDRFVDAPPQVRREGNILIIPVLEEVMVVEKRLRLREEIHVISHRAAEEESRRVTLRNQSVEVERLGENAQKPG